MIYETNAYGKRVGGFKYIDMPKEFSEKDKKIGAVHHAIDMFFERWFKTLMEKHSDNQQKAAIFVWYRYWAALRALHHLSDNNDYADT